MTKVSYVSADVVHGKCPKATGTPFNCTEVLLNFYQGNTYDQIKLFIYGFLPSSSDASRSLNLFAFNFTQSIEINHIQARLICNDETYYNQNFILFECDNGVAENIAPIFGLENYGKRKENDFYVFSRSDSINMKDCDLHLINEFKYVSYISPGKFFAIYGWNEINETMYDRGLWVFGKNTNLTVEEVSKLIDEVQEGLNLKQVVDFKKNLIINTHISFLRDVICPSDTYYFRCYNQLIPKKAKSLIQLEKIAFFIIIGVILTIVVITTCVYCISK